MFQIMDLMSSSSPGLGDAHLASFIEEQNQKQRFQSVVHSLTEQCWELCGPSISSRLDGKSETCLMNCVERFIDSSNYIINKLGHEGAAAMGSSDFSSGATDTGLQAPDFSSDYHSSGQQDKKKDTWKLW